MAIDGGDFRRSLAQFASGVTVVTTIDGQGDVQGLTVSSFCSVSLDPPLVLVCIDHRSEACHALEHSKRFAVSVLEETQADLSRRFAAGGSAKFTGIELLPGENGAPLVPGALAHLECTLTATHEGGDHIIFVGEVTRLAVTPGAPLVYHGSTYHRVATPSANGGGEPKAGAAVPDRV